MVTPGIERKKRGKHFEYFLDGQKITDQKQIEYCQSLRIPPAWTGVTISPSSRSKVQARGYDKAGRLQYIYNPSFRARQEQAKFDRITRFAKALPRMRRTNAKHLKNRKLDRNKVMACIVNLMDQAYFRVGNDVYAQRNDSYGLTTIRSKHTEVRGDTIVFDFVGKSGKRHTRKIADRQLARVVKQLDELPGYEVFKYYDENGNLKDVKSEDVNAYIKEVMGEEFTAKDFRTWGGTLLASAELVQAERLNTERERKKTVTACVKHVAKQLGNTPAIARSSYIDPRLIEAFMTNKDLRAIRKTVDAIKKSRYMSPDEHCVLKIFNAA